MKILQIFKENDKWSGMRVVTISTCLIIIFAWLIVVIKTGGLVDIPFGVVEVFASCLFGKAAQKYLSERRAKKLIEVENEPTPVE